MARAQAGRTGKAGSQKRITERGNAAVSKAKATPKKSLYNAKGQLKERPKRGR